MNEFYFRMRRTSWWKSKYLKHKKFEYHSYGSWTQEVLCHPNKQKLFFIIIRHCEGCEIDTTRHDDSRLPHGQRTNSITLVSIPYLVPYTMSVLATIIGRATEQQMKTQSLAMKL